MIAIPTVTSTKSSTFSSSPSIPALGCISFAILFSAFSTNTPNTNVSKNKFPTSSIITAPTTELYAYNSGNNIVSYFSEDFMCSNMLRESLVRLGEIKKLEHNWNGYGAEPFSVELINKVEKIIRGLSRQPDIYPTAQSSIQLEYNNENGDYLEFEVFNNGKINKFILKRNGESISQKRISIRTLYKAVELFYGQ